MEENRTMILAGDIGGTRTRLAAFETEGSKLKCVIEKTYPSQDHSGLAEIVADFVKTEGIPVHSACLAWPGRSVVGAARYQIFHGPSIRANWPSS
jgi:glucokinase